MQKKHHNTKFIALMGMFIGMSVVGGFIKLPNPITSSVAFDSMPAFLATLILGGVPGAIIGFLGHMASAATGGFPLTLPIHLFIGFQMAVIMLVFDYIARKFNIVVASLVGVFLNGIVAPACFIPIPNMGMGAFMYLVPALSLASTLNILAAVLIYRAIKNTKPVKELKEEGYGL